MIKMYYDKDAKPALLKKKKVAIIGYGSQGHAHANNLRDSGVDVIIGIRKGLSHDKAKNAGFKVMVPAEAAKAADVVMILLPDEYMADTYRAEIGPEHEKGRIPRLRARLQYPLRPDRAAHPILTCFMAAPKGPGHLVRAEYTKGSGVPC